MKKSRFTFNVFLLILFVMIYPPLRSQELNGKKGGAISGLAPTPPLGYNSFDSYLVFLDEEKANAMIDIMAEKYKPFGYEYFVVDAGWYNNVELYKGTNYPKKKLGLTLDGYGLPEPSKAYFPSGIKALADHAHEKGLKFGVWIIRGIPKSAVEKNLPIKGTPYRARDIADTTSICVWSDKNYGVDMSKPGAQEYYNSLIDKLASWGVDYIKVDDMVPNPKEIVAIAKAIENGGHKMMYSLSPGGVNTRVDLPYYKKANMLRITSDIWDNQLSIEKGFYAWEKFSGLEGKDFWPDLDMIPFGRLCIEIPDFVEDVPEEGRNRQSHFTQDQMKTFLTQRALAASPLFIGGDLLTMDDFSYSLLTNKEMLACNQNGVMGVNVYRAGNLEVWLTSDKDEPGKGWIGIFNRTTTDRNVKLSKYDLGFTEIVDSYNVVENKNAFKMKDIWGDSEFIIDGYHQFLVPANGVVFIEFTEITANK
ncbi:glycoside hydrolase family 27 protein [Maribacter sp. ANRC-HE7]|uniref:Alpha-galactosidase n=1 Tax=Maribacter aquimaris TaxID=2737171 RepID=A0ABR7V0X6_9FLAO|nr:glycoside hydrolase family 27 protein [Maribacter aquimaris]MBD0777574.1 glycoside hydrolase family 27 protein [Maribacter aquimaris]